MDDGAPPPNGLPQLPTDKLVEVEAKGKDECVTSSRPLVMMESSCKSMTVSSPNRVEEQVMMGVGRKMDASRSRVMPGGGINSSVSVVVLVVGATPRVAAATAKDDANDEDDDDNDDDRKL